MNEELKIIIKAVTDEAKKNIQGIKQELGGVSGSAKGASKGFGTAMKGIGKAAGIAIGAIAAIGAALVALGKKTLDYQKAQAKLNTAFQSVGSTAQQAAESYQGLYRFLGDADTSVEAAGHLAKLTTNQKELAEWTKICQGVYATFGDSLKIEALTEAANETARVGQVTGAFADALNWAGASEDDFNAKLAATTSYEEREALIRSTLNSLYGEAAEIYEKNNKELLAYNESQARMEASMGAAGKAVVPLLTALNNLSAALFDALKPAIDVIVPALATFIGWITKGIEAVLGFFGVITGGSTSVKTFSQMGGAISSATTGTGELASGLGEVEKAAEKAKRATMGFDELNIVSSGSSSSSSGSGSSAPGYMAPTVDASKFTVEVEQTEVEASGFAKTMKKLADEIKDVFAPTITAWTDGFDTIKEAWNDSKDNFKSGASDIKDSLFSLGSYIVKDYVPSLVNSFSTNLAPVITDVLGFAIEEVSLLFKDFGEITEDATNEIIIPALDALKEIYMDMFESIGDAWEEKGKPFLEEWSELNENVRDTVKDLYETSIKPTINKIVDTLKKAWDESLGPAFEEIINAFMEIGQCLMELYNEFIAPIVDWIVTYVVPIIQGAIDDIIEYFGKLLEDIGNAISGIVNILKGLIKFITGVFTGDWEQAWEGIKDIFGGVWDVIVSIVDSAWETIKFIFDWEKVKEFFAGAWEAIKAAFAGVVEWFSNSFNNAKEAVKTAWGNIGDWFSDRWDDIKEAFADVKDWFKEKFDAAWASITEAFANVKTFFSEKWADIKNAFSETKTWFKNTFNEAWTNVKNAWSEVKNFFSQKWEDIKAAFAPVKDWFKNTFSGAWTNIKTSWSEVKNFFSQKWTDIKTTFAPVKDWFKEKFSGAWTEVKLAWKDPKTFFSNVWSNIKSAFGNIPEWFRTKFHDAWTKVKNVFSNKGEVFEGIKEGILEGLKAVINKLIDGINKVIAIPFNGINSALKKIKDTSIFGAKPFDFLPTINVPQIPKLAKGGIVDRATLAMIGERGKEAVVPLENNTEWIEKLAERLSNRSETPTKIVLMLDGKELGWANINSINSITRQTGALQLQLA